MSRCSTFLLLLFFFSSHAKPARAQIAPAPDAPPAAPETSPAPVAPAAKSSPQPTTLQATANLVLLDFVARGADKKLVPGLTRSDCAVTEDSRPQAITSFTAENNQSLTLAVLLDTSLSQQRVLPTEKRAAAAFLRSILQPNDEALLIAFDVDVAMLSDFTASVGNLKKAIDGAHINSASGNYANGTIPSIGKPKGTLLYDAVVLASKQKLRQEAGRKALILLTDGVDEGSENHLKQAMEAAQKANAIVYVLLISTPGLYGAIAETDAGPMEKLARATGGEVFKIGSSGQKMQAAFEAIQSQLRSQYQIAYTPSHSARDGTYRRVHIACHRNAEPLRVQARQGYYATSNP